MSKQIAQNILHIRRNVMHVLQKCFWGGVSDWLALCLVFVGGACRTDVLGLMWMALVLTVTVELTWNLSSNTLGHICTHTCPSYTTCIHTHTFLRAFSRHRQTLHVSGDQEAASSTNGAPLFFFSKNNNQHNDIKRTTLWTITTSYMSPPSYTFLCCVPRLLRNETSHSEMEKKKGFYFDKSKCYCVDWNVKTWTGLGRAAVSTTPVCYVSWDPPD